MANKRSIPTRFFKDPDIINLSKEAQLILIGLALGGDDEGRGVAHAKLLGREMDYPPEQIETALQELAENDLIILYQVGRHRYYQLKQDWQENLGVKRTPSKLPTPPQDQNGSSGASDGPSGGNDGSSGGKSAQEKVSKENRSEVKEEKEDAETPPANITPFPTAQTTHSDGDSVICVDEKRLQQTTHVVAKILRLPETEALQRVVADFLPDPTLSLEGEADMAREYINDPERNHRHKTMSPAFYRRWLKREQTAQQQRASQAQVQATGTTGLGQSPGLAKPTGLASRSLMHLETQYQHTRSSPQAQEDDPS